MLSLPLVRLWPQRSMLFYFSLMNIKLLYKGTYLGFLWSALEPLLIFSLLYIVFTNIRDTNENFAIYLITGVLIHHLFARGTMNGLTSLTRNRGILISLKINKEFFPVVSTFSTCILMTVEFAVFFTLMAFFEFIPSWTIIFLPVLILLFVILVQGVTYFLSMAHTYVRDIQQIWSVLVYALLFVSPIFWYVDEASGILLEIHKINPLGQLIEIGHKIVLHEIPSFEEWVYVSSIILGILFIGYLMFQKLEYNAIEKI